MEGSLAVSIKIKVGHILHPGILILGIFPRELLALMKILVCPILFAEALFFPSDQRTGNNLCGCQ